MNVIAIGNNGFFSKFGVAPLDKSCVSFLEVKSIGLGLVEESIIFKVDLIGEGDIGEGDIGEGDIGEGDIGEDDIGEGDMTLVKPDGLKFGTSFVLFSTSSGT